MEDHRKKLQSDVEVCGPFQICLSAIVCTIAILGTWSVMNGIFLVYNPGWTCVDPAVENNLSVPAATTGLSHQGTAERTYSRPNSSIEDICELAKSCPRIVFDPETSTIVTEWSLICDRAWIASIVISIQMVGVVVGTLLTGYCGDRFGRKITLYTCVVVSAVMNVVAVFSVSWQMFAAVQLILGLSIGGTMSLGFIYHQEFVTSQWRLCLNVFPNLDIGVLIFGGVVWLLKDWRNIHITTAVFAGLILLTVFWVPESLKWLVVQGKTEQAKMVVEKIYKFNRRPCPPGYMINFANNVGTEMEKKTNFLLLFKRQVIKKTVISCSLLFLHSVMFFGIGFGIRHLFGNFYVNLVCFISMKIPVAALSPCVANKLGRRYSSFILITFAALISFSVTIVFFTLTGSDGVRGTTIAVLALASSACVSMSWCVLKTFIAETFPTTIRSIGYSFATTGARVGGIVAPFCIPQSPDLLYVPYLGMGVLAMACGAMVMSLPETKGQSLENTMSDMRVEKIDICDKDDASGTMLSHNNITDTIM